MVAVRPALVSEAEFLGLPESVDKVELLDGEVLVSPAPSPEHQRVVRDVLRRLADWADTRGPVPTVLASPLDVRFAPDRILQPDVAVWLKPLAPGTPTPVDRVPDLCVEVLSTNRVHDRVTKRFVYGAAGVREYWVVEPDGVVERFTGADLAAAEVVVDTLQSPLLPGFELDLETLRPPAA